MTNESPANQSPETIQKENHQYIKEMEQELKEAFKADKLEKAMTLIKDILKIDPKNRGVKKMEDKVKQRKIHHLASEIKDLMAQKHEILTQEKANEVLKIDPHHAFAIKILKKIAASQKTDWQNLVTVPNVSEKGLFSWLFGKKKRGQTADQQQTAIPSIDLPAPEMPSVAAPAVSPTAETTQTGNTFTRLFGSNDPKPKTASIIDHIMTRAPEKKKEVQEKKTVDKGERFLKYSVAFSRFSFAFILLSAAFFYVVTVDQENRVMALFGKENYAIQLKSAAQELEIKKEEQQEVNSAIERYKKGYDNRFSQKIDEIIASRLDWSELMRKLNEVTESVYEKNQLAQYVQYHHYAYDVDTGQLTVSGTLTDPLGKNLTKLAELEEAFLYYPNDKENKNSDIQPYFYNLQEFQSYSKRFDPETGRYTSDFSLSVSTKQKTQK